MSENYINEIKDEIKDVSKKASDVFSDVKIAMEEEKFYDNFSNKINGNFEKFTINNDFTYENNHNLFNYDENEINASINLKNDEDLTNENNQKVKIKDGSK